MEFKGTKGKWKVKVTRSSNFNGDEAIVLFSETDNPAIDKGVCRLTILNGEGKVVQEVLEMKANALLISKASEMLEMLQKIVLMTSVCNGTFEDFRENYNDEIKQLIKQATEL